MEPKINQDKLTSLISDCIDNYQTIKMKFEWYGGIVKEVLLSPYLLGSVDFQAGNYNFVFGHNEQLDDDLLYLLNNCIFCESIGTTFSVNHKIIFKVFQSKMVHKHVKEWKKLTDEEEGQLYEDHFDDEYYQQPCMYCGSETQCEHLLYDFDFCDSFRSAGGLIEHFYSSKKEIEESFLYLINNKIRVKFKKGEIPDILNDIWIEMNQDEYLYDSSYIKFVEYIIDEDLGSGEAITFRYASGGGPGNDDEIGVCYALNPELILEKLAERISFYLIPFITLKEQFEKTGKKKRSVKKK